MPNLDTKGLHFVVMNADNHGLESLLKLWSSMAFVCWKFAVIWAWAVSTQTLISSSVKLDLLCSTAIQQAAIPQ